MKNLDGLIAEDEKEGRAYLKLFNIKPQGFPIKVLNEHTKQLDDLLQPLATETWGLISDAGLPCIADPGAPLVLQAQKHKIAVYAVPGPCSITMALQLSGLSGQRFAFHGYISRDDKIKDLKNWEKRSQEFETQIFMEAPYRNESTFKTCLEVLDKKILFTIASDLTLPTQLIKTQTIASWQKEPIPLIDKHPTLFLFST